MKAIARTLTVVSAIFCATVSLAQHPANKSGTGSISGQITIDGKPASGIVVVMNQIVAGGPPQIRIIGREEKPFAKTTTDEEGRFTFSGLAAATYIISAATAKFISASDSMDYRRGKQLHLAEDEKIDDIKIPLIRGGVITGRVTDSEGRPIIAERVALYQRDEKNQSHPVYSPNFFMFETDDRGLYRLYGLPPGRYLVSVGVEMKGDMVRVGFGHSFYERTFHPDTTDESRAAILELTSGSEASADIKVGRASKAFSVSGRILYADTRQPVEGASCGYGALMPDGKNVGSYGSGYKTDRAGVFHLQGVLPGKYAAFSVFEGDNDYYSDVVPFEVTGEDVTGLEIRLHRGSSISGVIAVEGTDDPEILARITQLQIGFWSEDELRAPRSNPAKIASDGSFHIGGLKPGRVRLSVFSVNAPRTFQLMRIELDGADHTRGIDIPQGGTLSGVRIVVGYGTGRIRGQIKFESGQMPEGVRLWVHIARTNTTSQQFSPHVEVDQRGRFELSGLLPGEYIVALRSTSSTEPVRQTVNVTDNTDTEVTLVIPQNKQRDR